MPTHALIDVAFKHHNYQKVFFELSEVGCEFIQLRIFQLPLEENLIQELSAAARMASIRGVEIIAPFRSFEDRFWLINHLQSNGQISGITFHSAPVQTKEWDIALDTGQNIRFHAKRLNSSRDCGTITQASICAPTASNFRMLKVSNGCHTGKVGIDADGNIRNCPASRQSFGVIGQTPIQGVVLSANFQATWGITKDTLNGCKDCEFRYACTDCRVFIDSPDVKTAKPSKCTYDPYTGNWRSNVQC
jgi:SPASM domain peptide maturase of grasp-with-spasm system